MKQYSGIVALLNSIFKNFSKASIINYNIAGNVHVHRVQVLQNSIPRLILKASHDCSSHDILQRLNWMSVKQRGVYQTCLLMFKVLKCDHPEYLNIFNYQSYNYVFRSSHNLMLDIPKANTEAFKKSFSYSGPLLWNRLPNELKDIDSLSRFKTVLKQWILNTQ